jgi:uncharacterized protein
MRGETDLTLLLKSMNPTLQDGEYVFCSVNQQVVDWSDSVPLCIFREEEGVTLILRREDADRRQLPYGSIFRMITLSVHSSLEAVGFIAAIATQLVQHGISTNPISAFYHDHLFIPASDADKAMVVLQALSNGSA